MLNSWFGFPITTSWCGFQGVDFLSGLRTVDFRVWMSYLDVRFDSPSAVTRLTVDRADAKLHPHVFSQSRIPKGSGLGPPNIDLNKSRSLLFWLSSTHSWWGVLAPRNFTQDVLLRPANLPMKQLSGLYPQYLWSCHSGWDFPSGCRTVGCWCL